MLMEPGEHSQEHVSLRPAESKENYLTHDEVHRLHSEAVNRMRSYTQIVIENGDTLPMVDDGITRSMRAVSERAERVSRMNPSAKLLRDALLEHVDLSQPAPSHELETQFKKDVDKQMKVEETLLRKQGRGDDDTALKERRAQVEARLIRDREGYSSLTPSAEQNVQKQVTVGTLEERYKKAQEEYNQRMDDLWTDQDETKNTEAREAKDKMIAAKKDYDQMRGPQTLQELEEDTARRQAEIDAKIAAHNSKTPVASKEFKFGRAQPQSVQETSATISPNVNRTIIGEQTIVQPVVTEPLPSETSQNTNRETPLSLRLLPIDEANFGAVVKSEVDALQDEYRNNPSENSRRNLDQKLREIGLVPDSNPFGVVEPIGKKEVKTSAVEVTVENHPEEGSDTARLEPQSVTSQTPTEILESITEATPTEERIKPRSNEDNLPPLSIEDAVKIYMGRKTNLAEAIKKFREEPTDAGKFQLLKELDIASYDVWDFRRRGMQFGSRDEGAEKAFIVGDYVDQLDRLVLLANEALGKRLTKNRKVLNRSDKDFLGEVSRVQSYIEEDFQDIESNTYTDRIPNEFEKINEQSNNRREREQGILELETGPAELHPSDVFHLLTHDQRKISYALNAVLYPGKYNLFSARIRNILADRVDRANETLLELNNTSESRKYIFRVSPDEQEKMKTVQEYIEAQKALIKLASEAAKGGTNEALQEAYQELADKQQDLAFRMLPSATPVRDEVNTNG